MKKIDRNAFYRGVLWIIALLTLITWLLLSRNVKSIEIKAPQDTDAELPVYAQFTVTQTVRIDSPIRLSQVHIPVHTISQKYPVTVSINHQGKEVHSASVDLPSLGIDDVVIDLTTPVLVDGELRVTVNGGTYAVKEQDQAPRVFVDKDDQAYPGGNYSIAANQKKGDVSMSIYSAVSNAQHVSDLFQKRPFDTLAKALLLICAIAFVAEIPSILTSRNEEHTSPETTA